MVKFSLQSRSATSHISHTNEMYRLARMEGAEKYIVHYKNKCVIHDRSLVDLCVASFLLGVEHPQYP